MLRNQNLKLILFLNVRGQRDQYNVYKLWGYTNHQWDNLSHLETIVLPYILYTMSTIIHSVIQPLVNIFTRKLKKIKILIPLSLQ